VHKADSDKPTVAVASPQTDDGVSAQIAHAGLLEQIVEYLPIALTVQDNDGRFILGQCGGGGQSGHPGAGLDRRVTGGFPVASRSRRST